MKATLFSYFVAVLCPVMGLYIPEDSSSSLSPLSLRQSSSCQNTATSRGCWGDFSIDTDFYQTWPNTGKTREYWLNVEDTILAPDGYERHVLSFNGTIPGPLIEADWGDDLVIHVTNNLQTNGTAIHWHGIRQLKTSEYDGVPGVTQCPTAPGNTMTYRFKATQHGTTWYHSHFTLQYANGLLGPITINGPASADYDEDLGSIFLSDWSHRDAFQLWRDIAKVGAPPALENGLINGTNVFDCSKSTDAACKGTGKRFETTFTPGTKYRIRLVNTAVDGYIRFAIDGHSFQVIANDLVPIIPYTTDNLLIGIGQRYDIVVEASVAVDNYWLRAIWQTTCSSNDNANNILGIVRYKGADTSAVPTTTSGNFANLCGDEPLSSLVPHVKLNVGDADSENELSLGVNFASNAITWTINSSSLLLDWENPTELQILNSQSPFPTDYNVYPITSINKWTYWIIQDKSGIGLTHPIHLHGHDFWVVAQGTGTFSSSTKLNLSNPTRRDVASLPGGGFLALAFPSDNPGSWLMHCHIAWHASQGLALQFVERESEIAATIQDPSGFKDQCSTWKSFYETPGSDKEDDSGI